MRRALEHDGDLSAGMRQTLSRAQIERYAAPAPVIDKKFESHKSVRGRIRFNPWLLTVAGNRFAIDLARAILAANHSFPNQLVVERSHGLEDFDFFVAHSCGVERGGSFHSHERGQLQDVALNHVAHRAGGFVKCGSPLDSQRLSSGDLDTVDVVAIPERFEDAVPKAKYQHVLDGFFSKVMVDTVDLRFVERIENGFVEFLRGGQVAAERLFDNDARPRLAVFRFGKIYFFQLLDDVRVNFGRSRQIKKTVAASFAFAFGP